MSRNLGCALCEHFSFKATPEPPAGMGRCSGFEGSAAPQVEPFVAWNAVPCVLYGKSRDWQAREQWVQRKRAEPVSQ